MPRYGGRGKNTPNKRTIALREAAAKAGIPAEVVAKNSSEVLRVPRTSRSVLESIRDTLMGMAAAYQPSPPTAGLQNEHADYQRFMACLDLAAKCASELQQYEQPKLKAVAIALPSPSGQTLEHESTNVTKLPAGDALRQARIYRMVIEGKVERKVG